MYNQVIFYNHFGAGDIFESREFVKEWMRIVPANTYYYAHGKHRRILLDVENLGFKDVDSHMDPMRGLFDDHNGNLYVNTWIGRNGEYVLPGIGCTVEKLYQMHNDLLSAGSFGSLSRSPLDYIPKIDYSFYSNENIDRFIFNHTERKVLIDNGLVQSSQAENFDFNAVIDCLSKDNPDKCFVLSKHPGFSRDNVFNIGEIINDRELGFDLNEFSYLSLSCRYLIGRNSGPHVHTQVVENCANPDKVLLSFTYKESGSSFVVNTDVGIRKAWCGSTDFETVKNLIHEVINE